MPATKSMKNNNKLAAYNKFNDSNSTLLYFQASIEIRVHGLFGHILGQIGVCIFREAYLAFSKNKES
jgi:hypothetical protein